MLSIAPVSSQALQAQPLLYESLRSIALQAVSTQDLNAAIAGVTTNRSFLLNEPLNFVFAGPAVGVPAAPLFRALVPADLVVGSGAGTTNYLRADGTWSAPPGAIPIPISYANGGTNATTAWTQGSVFFGGATAFAQDPTNFFWDDTKHWLMIGASGVASAALDVAKAGGNADFFLVHPSSALAGIVGGVVQNNGGTFYIAVDNSTGTGWSAGNYSTIFGPSSNTPFSIITNNLPRMTILGGGGIGIGTINPTYGFSVGSSSQFGMSSSTGKLAANWDAGAFSVTSLNSEDCIQAAEYGVVANGSLTVSATGTDQTANMVAALTAAVTAGKKLRLPSGVIKFTQNVVIPDSFGTTTWVDIDIEGTGCPNLLIFTGASSAQAGGTILKFWTGAGVHGISLSPGNNYAAFTLRNLEIQGPDNDTTTTSGDGVRIVSTNSAWVRCAFQNVDVNHFGGGAAYRLGDATHMGPENGSFINCSSSFCNVGFSFNGAANANNLYNCGVQYSHSRAIEILDSQGVAIYGGLIQGNEKTGIYMGGVAANGATQILVSNVYFENNNTTSTAGMYAAHVLATNAGGNCNYITFQGCLFQVANDKVWLDTTGAALVYGVSFIGCRQTPGPLVTVNTAAVSNTVFLNSGAPATDSGTGTSVISDSLTGNYSIKGKLGVGMAGPLSLLHVGNDTTAYGDSNAARIIANSGAEALGVIGSASTTNINYYFSGITGRAAVINSLKAGTNGGAFNFYTKPDGGGIAIGLTVDSKQSVAVGNAALATNATDGFLYIPSCAGTPTGVPTTYTGRVAMIYDTTNNKFWFYNGAWKRAQVTLVDAIYA